MVPQSLIRSASRAHARSAVRSSAQEEAKDDEGAEVPSSQIVQRSPRANLRQSLDSASSTSGDQPGMQRVEAAEPEDAGVVQPAQSRLSSEDRAMFDKIASQHGFKEAMEYLLFFFFWLFFNFLNAQSGLGPEVPGGLRCKEGR